LNFDILTSRLDRYVYVTVQLCCKCCFCCSFSFFN